MSKTVKPLDEEQKNILMALSRMEKPASGKEVAEASGIDSKQVSKQIKKLKTAGLVESPVRCKYSVTDTGKSMIN